MPMSFKDFLLQADGPELIKLANAMKTSFEKYASESINTCMNKLADDVTQQVTEQVKNIGAYVKNQQEIETQKLQNQGAVNDMALPEAGKLIDKKDLQEALEEAILANNPKALAQIISGVLQAGGEESAENAISVARTILQDALVSGKLTKEQIGILAEAFSVFDGVAK